MSAEQQDGVGEPAQILLDWMNFSRRVFSLICTCRQAMSDWLSMPQRPCGQEFRDCTQWKKLHCHKVSVFAERDRGTVCVVHVGNSVEFDWTWEGALAFRPNSLEDKGLLQNFAYEDANFEEAMLWKGEVLEVDERNGCLFISLDNPESLPSIGPFFVRPLSSCRC